MQLTHVAYLCINRRTDNASIQSDAGANCTARDFVRAAEDDLLAKQALATTFRGNSEPEAVNEGLNETEYEVRLGFSIQQPLQAATLGINVVLPDTF